MFRNISLERIIEVFVLFFILIIFSAGFIIKPQLEADALAGFSCLKSYLLNQTEFNHVLSYENQTNTVTQNFLTWWAIGQYYIPYLFALIIGELGNAIVFLNLLSILLTYFGLLKVARALNLSKWSVATILIIFFLSRPGINYLFSYTTSDIYLIPISVWLFWFQHKYFSNYILFEKNLAFIFVIGGLGLFIKNSSLVFLLAITLYNFLIFRGKNIKIYILASIFFFIVLINYLFFLSRGANPSAGQFFMLNDGVFTFVINLMVKPFISVFTSLFSFGTLLFRLPSADNTFFHSGMENWKLIGIVFLIPIQIIIVFFLIKKWTNLYIIPLTFVFCWMAFHLKGSNVAFSERLFFPTFLFLFMFYHNISKSKNVFFAVVVLWNISFSTFWIIHKLKTNHNTETVNYGIFSNIRVKADNKNQFIVEKSGMKWTNSIANSLIDENAIFVHGLLPESDEMK